MSVLAMLVGGGLTGAGVVMGRLLPSKSKTPKVVEVQPICGCTHHLAQHDPKTNACHQKVRRQNTGYMSWEQCTCRQYSGPVAVDQFFSPKILP